MEMFVKNMVCDRCIMTVKQRLELMAVPYEAVRLGEITFTQPPSEQQLNSMHSDLHNFGFELLTNRKSALISRIKSYIITYVHGDAKNLPDKKFSVMLAEKLQVDYSYLSSLFSSVEGITIEKYIILQRVERIKELLTYNEASLNEIADDMRYSSVQHLSQQFRKVTGLTPSQYKQSSKRLGRQPLDQIGS